MLIPRSFVSVRTALSAGVLLAAISVASPAQATTIIDFSTEPCAVGTTSCGPLLGSGTDGNLTLTASVVGFSYKTIDTEKGLGITSSGDWTPGEIDTNESISGAFSRAGGVKIDGFQLLFIYNGDEFADPFEKATITITNISNVSSVYSFQVNAENTGVWIGGPTPSFTSCGATDDVTGGTGCFDFTNPFGNLAVKSIKFEATPVTPRGVNGATNDSDYSLGSLSYSVPPTGTPTGVVTPEPASMVLLGSGLAGMFAARRRARAKNRQNS